MDIANLKELMGAATPGPWGVRNEDDHENPWCVTSESLPYVATINWAGSGREEANAALIVAAVNALPSLIARLEAADRLAAASREFSIALDHYKRHCATETDTPEMVEAIDAADEKRRAALTTYDQEKARG